MSVYTTRSENGKEIQGHLLFHIMYNERPGHEQKKETKENTLHLVGQLEPTLASLRRALYASPAIMGISNCLFLRYPSSIIGSLIEDNMYDIFKCDQYVRSQSSMQPSNMSTVSPWGTSLRLYAMNDKKKKTQYAPHWYHILILFFPTRTSSTESIQYNTTILSVQINPVYYASIRYRSDRNQWIVDRFRRPRSNGMAILDTVYCISFVLVYVMIYA